MQLSDKIAIGSAAISFVGVIVTGIFSYLMWIANKRSAEMAVETVKLNRIVIETQEKQDRLIGQQFIESILDQAKLAVEVLNTDEKLAYSLPTLLQQIRTFDSFPPDFMAKYFKPEEIKQIKQTWIVFEEYKSKAWFQVGDSKQFATNGEKELRPINPFKKLIEVLEKIKL